MQSKREKLEEQMHTFISNILDVAEAENKLDYIQIEISNHNGNLQMDYTAKDRKKVY